MIYNLWL